MRGPWSPDVLDRLPRVGSGSAAEVRRWGRYAVKIAHPTAAARARLADEIAVLRAWPTTGSLRAPRVYAVKPDGSAFVRDFVEGAAVSDLLDRLTKPLLDALWRARQEVTAEVDFSPPNLFWDGQRLTLVDGGRRTEPNRLLDPSKTRADLPEMLRSWATWRARRDRGAQLSPMSFPPSGRFAVSVPLGPPKKGGVVWINEGLRARLELPWGRVAIERMAHLTTVAPTKTVERLASRYQDTPELDDAGALGDGRTVYLGVTSGGAYGQLELQLKGCGPTPLAWKGHAYHEDGYVSFPRTLWETSIADELARLGFETPEMLAVLTVGETTVDNTDKRWPAASAIRVASTHARLGHLRRWSHRRADRGAFAAIVAHLGAKIMGSRFDPSRPRDLAALALSFARNLGGDVGLSDALNVHCFHPTLGNVRLDGHFIDFSTVRIFRHYLPDYRFLNGLRKVGGHRQIWRAQMTSLVAALAAGGLLDEGQSAGLAARSRREYERAYERGYWRGTARFLGAGPSAEPPHARGLGRFVDATLELKRQRGSDEVRFGFFQQTVRLPLFDVEGRAPELVASWRAGAREPWLRLVRPGQDASDEALAVAERWFVALGALGLDPRRLEPRRFHEVIRPGLEAEALSRLCYRRSTPRSFEAWKTMIATSRHLPEGEYDYFEARSLAKKLGHLALPGWLPGRYEHVVGLSAELHRAVIDVLRARLGDRLVGVLAHGSRVMTRPRVEALTPGALPPGARGGALRERGPDPRKSSDLDLKVFARAGLKPAEWARLELAIGQDLLALGARFPLCAYVPPKQRLIPTRATTIEGAYRHYAAVDRPKLGKPPIPPIQLVRVWEPDLELEDVPARVAASLDDVDEELALVPLSKVVLPRGARDDGAWPVGMLEVVLLDHPDLEPPAVTLDARRRAIAGASSVIAARRAGRELIRARTSPPRGVGR